MEAYKIAEKELPQEDLFQDGELNRKQAKQNLKRLFNEGRISSITFNYYINSYDWDAEEDEYHFNFRGESIGVLAESLECAYGYFYSTYPQVTKAELDEAYCGEEE